MRPTCGRSEGRTVMAVGRHGGWRGGISAAALAWLAVIEKPMVTGDGKLSYQDWSLIGSVGTQDGANVWASTDMPETLLPFFGTTCNNPNSTADDVYGSWGRDNCSYNGG